MAMAQSDVRGNHSSTGELSEGGDAGAPRPERETRTVTGHPEDHVPRGSEPTAGGGGDEPEQDRGPRPRFQTNRVSPAERDQMVKGARDIRFPVALRGYERVAVDRYVREVNRLIAELEISSSPESAIKHALDEVSEETRDILQQAHQTAEELTARSRSKADDRLQLAEREAQELRETSQRDAQELRESSQREAEETRERAATEAAATRERAATEARELRETAAAEARELRDTAAEEAEQLRQDAAQEAQRVRTAAQRESDQLRTSTRRDVEQMIEDGETKARDLSHSAETIWRERRRLIEDMRGVGEQLVSLGEAESKRFPRFSEELAQALDSSRLRGGHGGNGEPAAEPAPQVPIDS